MSSDHCRLLDLTPEVLLLIASYCDGHSLLHLEETCRTIRSLCDDVVVWQAALENRVSRLSVVAQLFSLTSVDGQST